MTEAVNGRGITGLANGAQEREEVTGQPGDLNSHCNSVLTADPWARDLLQLSCFHSLQNSDNAILRSAVKMQCGAAGRGGL